MRPFHFLCAAALLVGCKADSPGESGSTTTTDPTTQSSGPDPYDAAAKALFAKNHIVEIEISMDLADAEALGAETNDAFALLSGADCLDAPWEGAFTWYAADVRVDGALYEEVGIRKKGLLGSMSSEKPSLKLDFDKFVDGQSLDGIERLTLNNAISDRAMVSQCLGYQLFADAGIAAPRCNFAHVVVEGEDLGIYVNVEPYKKDFLRANYTGGNDGDLYEGTLSDFRDGWIDTFQPKTGSTDPDLTPIHAVAAALEIADEDAMLAALDAVLDVDRFLDFWAMEVIVGHVDGYAGNTNNFYVYLPEDSDQLEFLPWGIDWIFHDNEAFGASTTAVVMANSQLTRRLWDHPQVRADYLDRLQTLLDRHWDETALLAEVDRMAALIEPLAATDDSRAPAQEELRSFIRGRQATLEYQLTQPLPEFTEPLRTGICLVEAGSLRLDFDATWGTLESDDPLNEGASTVTGTLEGVPFSFTGGAVAGSSEGYVTIAGIGLTSPTMATYAAAQLPDYTFGTGTLPIDGQGFLAELAFTVTEEAEIVGSLWNAELVVTEWTGVDGTPVRGYLEGPLYTGGP